MNKTKTKIAILGIAALFVVLAAIPTVSAQAHVTLYFDPQDISVPEGYCNTREVKVMMNITAPTLMDKVVGGQFAIRYDPSCMNITDHPENQEWPGWGPNIDPWGSSWNANPHCWGDASGFRYDMVMYGFDGSQTGLQELFTFTVHCNSTEYCETDMVFDYGLEYLPPCPFEVIAKDARNLFPDSVTLVNGTFECGEPGTPEFDNVTTADIPVSGTVSGDHTLTWASNDTYESITEVASKGTSILEHRWTIDVISGTKTNVTFHLEANRTDNDESDDFKFEYWDKSLGEYVTMVTVNTNEDKEYSCKLPNETSGNVTIRVIDTDRSKRKKDLDTISIDHMFIRSVLGPPDITPPVITNVRSTPSYNSAIIEWDTDEISDSLVKYGTTKGGPYTDQVDNGADVTDHSIVLEGLAASTPYYYVVNSTDPSDNSAESDEYNFTTESPPSKPDLNITDIWCVYVRKNTYDIFYNITNNGIGDASESVSNLTVDGAEQKKKDSVGPLPSGQTSTEKFTYRGTPGTVKVCADCNTEVDESNEANNCLTNSSCTA